MALDRQRSGFHRVVRRPRLREIRTIVGKVAPPRQPSRLLTSPYILFYGFGSLIILGGLLLMLPISNSQGGFTSASTAFFTSASAVTVTGHSVVNTATYWSDFGQGVIFSLVLVGGLGFMTMATFFLVITGQRITMAERMLLRDTLGVDRLGGLVRVTRNIVVAVLGIYIVGMLLVWWRLKDIFPEGERLWQSAFLTVSSFNNAGFDILPQSSSLSRFLHEWPLLAFVAILIILGGIGWAVVLDTFKQRRFSRLTLDTKLVITTSLVLWLLGALVFFLAEFGSSKTLGNFSLAEKGFQSMFHSISARTAGFSAVDFSNTSDLTNLFYTGLMFIGGGAGSMAGGIKIIAFAVIVAAVLSSIKGRLQAEAFGREIPHFQVNRAITVAFLGVLIIFLVSLTLVFTEKDIPFRNLLFDTVSAFATTGLSTGIAPQLTLTGKIMFIIAMYVGRIGPITLALSLAPVEEVNVYRYAQERVRIG